MSAKVRQQNFDPRSSLLFLGSGFSCGAENIQNSNPPTGNELGKIFADLLKVGSKYELKDLADVMLKSRDHDLYQILYNNFTIRSLPQPHRDILKQPWRRIYTTNYDDAVEWHFAAEPMDRTPNSYSYQEKPPKHLRKNDVIHLHGYIRKCTRENVSEELLLGHQSYVEERLKGSPWYDVFSKDMDNASSIFFVGYSLSDFNIAAYLMQNPTLIQKTFFVTYDEPDQIFKTRVEPYGTICPIAVNGFADWCSNVQPIAEISDPKKLRSFTFLDPQKDDKINPKPTSPEIKDLMTFGHFNFSRLVSTFPNSDYVVQRQSALQDATLKLENSKTLVIHGYVGNGKTIFKNILALHLAKNGNRCFEYKHGIEIPEHELDYLRKSARLFPPIIFFSSYDDFRSAISQFSDMNENTRYVLEMDTGTFHVRQKELVDAALGNLEKTEINRLPEEDISDLRQLLDGAGLLRQNEFDALSGKNAILREYILDLFNNSAVRKKIRSVVSPLLENNRFKKFLVSSFIARVLDIELSPVFLRRILDFDPYDILSHGDESQGARDIFELGETLIQPRSAILVEFILKNFVEHDDIVTWVSELGAGAALVKNQEIEMDNVGSDRFNEAKHLLGNIFKYSNLKKMLGTDSEANSKISKIYETGRQNKYINKEPLFWLQYCIFQAQLEKLDLAEDYLKTAYERAQLIPRFRSYQLDTYALELNMRIEGAMPATSPVLRFEIIREKLGQIREMVGDGNHRYFAIQTLKELENFVFLRIKGMQRHEKVQLTYELNLIVARFENLPLEIKTQFGTNQVRDSIARAKNMLIVPE